MKKSAADPVPSPPKGYSREARALWRRVNADWVLDPAALVILETACRALQQDHAAEALVAREGLVLVDRFGQQKLHPAVGAARDAKSTFLRAMKQLGLDLEPVHPNLGRPPGRGV